MNSVIRWLAYIAKLGRNAWHAREMQVFSLYLGEMES